MGIFGEGGLEVGEERYNLYVCVCEGEGEEEGEERNS